MICYKERNLSFCTLHGVWGGVIFKNKFQILEKKFYFILLNFFCILIA